MASNREIFEKILLDSDGGVNAGNFSLGARELGINSPVAIQVEQTTLSGGKQQGVQLITLTLGDMVVRVVPTRGMAVMDVVQSGCRFGWDSPVKEIIHPAFVDQQASGGIGWLDGFNEMLVRCGFQWAGHPGLDGNEFLTLHGRIQNTPATIVKLSIDREPPYRVTLSGRVDEKRFKFTNYEIWMHLSVVPGEPYLEIEDVLTNKGAYKNEFQVIYHNNFGPPILEQGGKLHVAVAEISPFNNYAAGGMDAWSEIPAPTRGFDEMVFNVCPRGDREGRTLATLHNADASRAIELDYQIEALPVLTIWKNTDLSEQGYVMGIEPGTSFAYNRRYQRALGLVPEIAPGESRHFSLRFGFLTTPAQVAASVNRIKALQGDSAPKVSLQPPVQLDK